MNVATRQITSILIIASLLASCGNGLTDKEYTVESVRSGVVKLVNQPERLVVGAQCPLLAHDKVKIVKNDKDMETPYYIVAPEALVICPVTNIGKGPDPIEITVETLPKVNPGPDGYTDIPTVFVNSVKLI